MGKERKRIRDAFMSLYELMNGEIPTEYLNIFSHQYEGGDGESWLDLFPLVIGYSTEEVSDVVDFLSYINPRFFPPKNSIKTINFKNLVGGKGRKCTKGIETK